MADLYWLCYEHGVLVDRFRELGTGGARWKAPPGRPVRQVALFCLAGAIGICVLPYFLPVTPSFSDSYSLGFSNRGALVVFLLFALLFAWWRGEVAEEPANGGRAVSKRAMAWALGLTVLFEGTVWWYGTRLTPMHESLYLLDRLRHLAQGRRVYADFEFAYGAGLLYVPLWLSRSLHLSLVNGYFFSLMVECLVGVLLLRDVVDAVGTERRHGDAIFLLLFLTTLAWSLLFGVQYTPFRYWMAPWVAVTAFRLGVWEGRRRMALLTLAAGFAGVLFFSPEQAVALLGGVLLFAATFWGRRGWRETTGLGGFVMVAAVLLWIGYRLRMFDTFKAMASGGYTMPVTPAPDLLPGLGLLMVAGCTLVGAVRRRAEGTVGLLLICISVFLLPTALGRFDEVHLMMNTFSAAVVGWAVLARRERYWWWAWRGYVGIIFVAPMPLLLINYWHLGKVGVEVARYQKAHPPDGQESHKGAVYSPFGPLPANDPAGPYAVEVDTGRFYGVENIMTEKQAEEKVSEMQAWGRSPMVVGPHGCEWRARSRSVALKTSGLYVPKARFTATELEPMCREIREAYEPAEGERLPEGWVWMRRR